MNRRGAAGKAPILFLAGLVLVVGGAVAVYKLVGSGGPPAPSNPKGGGDKSNGDEANTSVGVKVKDGEAVQVPFIFWGGDVATFVANGGLETQKDSIFGRQGLNVQLTKGDDFDQQVKDYLANKSPFIRGTLSMLGQVSEQLNAKQETQPVVFLQLTWSAGDHFVGRANFKTLGDIKGKKIAIQKGGPHVGMLNDILRTAKVDWKDITVVWTDDVTGDKGPPALFRKDPSIDACFAITPDRDGLTGGLETTGDGKNDTVPGAHVVVSTQYMSHSIADVYACRSDFWAANKDWVQKFAAGYLKSVEELVDAKKAGAAPYKAAIKLAQDVWGKYDDTKGNVAKEDDVDGLISDSTFVGLPGNVAFFTAKGNLTGYGFKLAQSLQLPDDPATQPFKVNPKSFRQAFAGAADYDALAKLGGLTGKEVKQDRFAGVEYKFEPEKVIYTFTITFAADSHDFSEAQYGQDFQRALEEASLFGNAVVAIRGHATPIALIERFLEAGVDSKLLTYNDGTDTYTFTKGGKKLDLSDIHNVLQAIADNPNLALTAPDGSSLRLTKAVQSLQELSDDRAKAVRQAIINYAQSKGLVLQESQMRSEGVGVKEPIVHNPKDESQSARNRRVEFSIIKVPADQLKNEFGL